MTAKRFCACGLPEGPNICAGFDGPTLIASAPRGALTISPVRSLSQIGTTLHVSVFRRKKRGSKRQN